MAVMKMMDLINGGLTGPEQTHRWAFPFPPLELNKERNGLHAPNTRNHNREEATGTSPRAIPTPSPSVFVIEPIAIIVTTLTYSLTHPAQTKVRTVTEAP